MEFIVVVNQVLIIFLIMLAGFICKKMKILGKEVTKGLSGLLLNVTIPCAIISSFNQALPENALAVAAQVLFYALLIHLVSIFLGMFIFRNYPRDTRNVLWFAAVFPNCAFMGFPVMESLLGQLGIFYGSMYVAVSNFLTWTFGQMLFTGKKDKKALLRALFNPGIISILIGLAVFFSPVRPPFVVARAVDMLGAVTTPLAMLIIGATLAEVNVGAMFSGRQVYLGAVLRLAVLPALTLASLKAAGLKGDLLEVCCVLTAMPAAALLVIFTEKFNGDSILASRIVALSTLLSVATIPAVILLL